MRPANFNTPKRMENLLPAISGSAHHLWLGDDAGYDALHSYLGRHFPKTGACDECRASAKTQYALIHGKVYSRNRDDYRELCPRCHARYDHGGERNPQARLTEAQVIEIRRRHVPGKGGGGPGAKRKPNSMRSLAEEFGVCYTTIKKIVSGKKWAVVPMPEMKAAGDG